MSHDETNTEDKAVARALLGHAVSTEPQLDLDPHALLRIAHRRASRRRTTVTLAVMLGVITTAVGAVLLVGASRGRDPAAPEPTTASPAPAPIGDERSQRLTKALAEAHVIPQGLTVEPDPRSDGWYPLEFDGARDSYHAYAQLRDSRGYGRLVIGITGSAPATDVVHCTTHPSYVSCFERTLQDGSEVRVVTVAGPVGVPDSTMKWLTVIRPNKSFLEVYVDNSGEFQPPDTTAPPSRDQPPLSDDDLLHIAEIPGLTY